MGSKYNKNTRTVKREKSIIQFYLHNLKHNPNIVINSPSLNPFSFKVTTKLGQSNLGCLVFSPSLSCSKKDNSFSGKSTKRAIF